MYRKILVTDGMSNDLLLFMTDAPMEKIVEFMIAVKKAVDNGDSTTELYEGFKAEWLFKVLLDSELETDTNLWIEEGFNMDCVYPEYNMIGG